jgi:hypothetical protein
VSPVQVLSAVVALTNLMLALVVGVRLLRLSLRSAGLPERTLGLYFLASAFLGALMQIIAFGSIASDALNLSEGAFRLLYGTAILGMAIGAAGVLFFTWRTFRPSDHWAALCVGAGLAVLCTGFLFEALEDSFALVLIPEKGHWLGWAGRTLPLLWVSAESFRYHVMLSRRVRLGLVEPVLANRFLLWAIWAAAAFCNLSADLVARVIYALRVGPGVSEVIPEVATPIVLGTVAVTMVLGVVSGATLFLTFFAPERYRHWIESRSQARIS